MLRTLLQDKSFFSRGLFSGIPLHNVPVPDAEEVAKLSLLFDTKFSSVKRFLMILGFIFRN